MRSLTGTFILLITFLLFSVAEQADAQVTEPELRVEDRVAVPLSDNYRSGLTFDIVINNFGFGLGGEYRRVIGSQTEGVFNTRITGLRDASEQTFTDFFGQQAVPNKYQRAFAFPAMIGMRQRLFADKVQEEYRFFVTLSAGPVAAFAFPYFDDRNDNGYREQGIERPDNYFEPINDIFSGWSSGEWHFGAAGEFKFGLDFGRTFSRVTSVEFSYHFNFFPDGIQMMMPTQPDLRENVAPNQNPFQYDEQGELILEPFFDAQRFFGTPQITITFGRLW
ncbi:hypothetical protein DYD21_00835 [Rhodohalobacter sp. SW132]|uniref:hypothetical protein n=1 Tax=Rhodohalobacter sp. SW132 TaxID=2293433 RepID=UPI000E22631E|nr:hypothetical protein [Rhodohalobacter sp. SW132]REL38526.1 hypothetical protein DYD21_00835 [Rhodohalobacter sp. SW132]